MTSAFVILAVVDNMEIIVNRYKNILRVRMNFTPVVFGLCFWIDM